MTSGRASTPVNFSARTIWVSRRLATRFCASTMLSHEPNGVVINGIVLLLDLSPSTPCQGRG